MRTQARTQARKFTPKRNLTPTSTQVSYFNESVTDYNTRSYRTSNERSQDKQSSIVKDKVLSKLRNYIQNHEKDSYKSTQSFNLQLRRIGQLSPKQLAQIYLSHTPKKSDTFIQNHRVTPKDIIANQFSTTAQSSGYKQLYYKRQIHAKIVNQPTSIGRVINQSTVNEFTIENNGYNDQRNKLFNEQKNDTDQNNNSYFSDQRRVSITENLKLLFQITNDKELQKMKIDFDERQQNLNEYNLEILGIKMEIRQINNSTLKENWEHQDQIRKFEVELIDYNKQKETQQSLYQKQLIQLSSYQLEDETYQSQFHILMEEINSLKKIKRNQDPIEQEDSQQTELDLLIEKNKMIKLNIAQSENQLNQIKNPSPNFAEKQRQSKLKLEEIQARINSLDDKKNNLKKDCLKITKQQSTISPIIIEDQQIQKLNLDIQDMEDKNSILGQELQFLSKPTTDDIDQEQKIIKQQNLIDSMKVSHQEIQSQTKKQDQQISTQIDDKERIIQEIQQQTLTLNKLMNSDYMAQEVQDQLKSIKQNTEQLLTYKQTFDKRTQENLLLQDQVTKTKEEAHKNNDNSEILSLIEKMDNQSDALSRQVNKRKDELISYKDEIEKLQISQAVNENDEEDRKIMEEVMLLKQQNSKSFEQNSKLKDTVEQMKRQNSERENLMLKYRKETGELMQRFDDCSQRERVLIGQIKTLDKQMAEK